MSFMHRSTSCQDRADLGVSVKPTLLLVVVLPSLPTRSIERLVETCNLLWVWWKIWLQLGKSPNLS